MLPLERRRPTTRFQRGEIQSSELLLLFPRFCSGRLRGPSGSRQRFLHETEDKDAVRAFNGCADDDVGEVKNHNPPADHYRCGLERLWMLRAEFIHFFLETFPA